MSYSLRRIVGRTMMFAVVFVVIVVGAYMTIGPGINFSIDLGTTSQKPMLKGEPAAPPHDGLPSTGPIVRTFARDSGWQRVWLVGSDTATDVLIEPRQVVVSGNLVAVLDAGTREVRAFDAHTGAARFVLLPRGQGPGEFKRPSLLASTPSGVAVLDEENARLTAYDRQGRLEWDVVLNDGVSVRALCIRGGPRIAALYYQQHSSIVEYDTAGNRTAVREMVWPAENDTSASFGYSTFVSDVNANGACVLAPIFSPHWAVLPPSGPVRAYAYREPGAAATISTQERMMGRDGRKVAIQIAQSSDSPHASRGALIIGDTAIIVAAQTKRFRYKTLDYHNLNTGEYLYSRILPGIFNALTIGPDGTFYGTIIRESTQFVLAMRPSVTSSTSVGIDSSASVNPKRNGSVNKPARGK